MTRRKTIFSFDLRVLMCDKCGAAIDGTIVGGTAVCRFCNTTNHVVKRAERHAAAPPGPRMSEAGRLDLLRGQDGRAAQVPPDLRCVAGLNDRQIQTLKSAAGWQIAGQGPLADAVSAVLSASQQSARDAAEARQRQLMPEMLEVEKQLLALPLVLRPHTDSALEP